MNNPVNKVHPNIEKISLKQLFDKLFADENLCRIEHIQYAANLLAEYNTDEYLQGLHLDSINFDITTDVNLAKPELLNFNQRQKISATPITFYINSIAQIPEENQHAIIWNILILKAALYLIALPEIEPERFKKNHTEHFNTVKKLLQRFRAANKVLIHAKSYKNSNDYLILWGKHLQYPELSLLEFVRYLENYDKKCTEFEHNLLNDLRVIFTYISKNKAKVSKPSSETKLQHEFIDEDQLIEESSEIPKGSKSKAIIIEKQLDDEDNRQIHVDPSVVTPIARYSESVQSYVLPLISKHILRKEHLLQSSSLFPNATSTSKLLDLLYRDYQADKNTKISVLLMLCFITGNSFKEWIHAQSKRVKNLNARQQLMKQNGQYFLRTKFSIFANKDALYPQGLLNQTISLDIPLPNEFIEILKNEVLITEKKLLIHLSKLIKELSIPKLSLIKTSSLLHQYILQHTGNRQLADILTGIDANKTSSISYCHHQISNLQHKHIEILQRICPPISSVYEGIQINNKMNLGSRIAPKKEIVTEIFALLKTYMFMAAENDLVALYNYYNLWMWHLLLLFTACRPVAEFPGFLNRFNLNRKIFMISDKDVGGRDGYGRLIPLCDFVVAEINKFLKFLTYFKDTHYAIQQSMQDILDSQLPLLHILDQNGLQPLTSSIVKKFNSEFLLEQANWHRHTTRAFLTHKINEIEILALFGHEPIQQEVAHPYSSFSFSQYKKIANALEQMKEYFAIKGIEIDVLIS